MPHDTPIRAAKLSANATRNRGKFARCLAPSVWKPRSTTNVAFFLFSFVESNSSEVHAQHRLREARRGEASFFPARCNPRLRADN